MTLPISCTIFGVNKYNHWAQRGINFELINANSIVSALYVAKNLNLEFEKVGNLLIDNTVILYRHIVVEVSVLTSVRIYVCVCVCVGI